MGYDHSVIFERESMSDETGLLAKISGGYLQSFIDSFDLIKFTIIGWNNVVGVKPYFTVVYNRESGLLEAQNGNFDSVTLFCEKYGYVCGLTIKIELSTDTIYFYDAYYDLDFDSTVITSKNTFIPFTLRTVYGNKNSKLNKISNSKATLCVDEYTNAIIGAISDIDCAYSEFKNIVVDTTHPQLMQLAAENKITKINNLVGNYYYIDNQFVPVQDNISLELNNVIKIRQQISYIRQLEKSISNEVLISKLFNEEKTLQDIQKEKYETSFLIQNLRKEVTLWQQQIKNIKSLIQKQKIDNFINTHQYKYYSSLCLLIKDENEYLEEWLNHFYNLGIEHFYIYDNKSKTPIIDTIKSIQNGFYLDKCDVILFTEYDHMQYDCYEDCLKRCEFETKWIGFMDTDEFLEFTDETTNINNFLKNYEHELGVWIPWEVYNANGLIEKPIGKVQDNFTNVVIDPLGLFGKVFIQTAKVQKMYVHSADSINHLYKLLDQNQNDLKQSFDKVQEEYKQHLNIYPHAKIKHYFTRSYEEWCEKMSRGTCDPNFKRKFDVFFRYNRDLEYLKDKELLATEQGYN